ncbi:facilitated trehalose transporter Tret1 [Manduca sexta]|uniref:Major facilitator superfamily (MFS) profile domain-containing protein n=1 Tax=Manduca sexta TaxID=7130 RepID=A0A921YWS6_MANSE|nr:facilitated trehalose transporter Tret1 [Manduca sexta]KAG6446655.1 hypothetical protein O3G_MSEX004555 [Manduca sexta]
MANEKVTPFAKQCFVTLAVGINLIGHGAVMGFAAVLLPQIHEDSGFVVTKTADSWIASVIGLTLLIGNFFAAPVMGPLGRKVAHYTISVSAIVGWLVTILATSVEALIVGRIIQGLSFGMMLPLRSILIGEYTSPKYRGAFLTTVSLTQGFGIFFVHLLGSLVSWQKTALICVFLPFTSLVMTIFCPESPSWLAAKGRYDECRTVFHWLRGTSEDQELEAMIKARQDFQEDKVNRKNTTLIETVKKKEFYKPIILMVHTYAMGQVSGATSMAAYSTTIIKLIMSPNVNAEAWMIGLDAQRLVGNTLAIYVINRFRRRTMMFLTGGISFLSHLAIITYVCLRNSGVLTYDEMWVPGLLVCTQFFAIAIGMGPLPSVIAGEVFPLEYRSIAGTISIVAIAGTLFVVLKTFQGLVDALGIEGTYGVYAAIIGYSLVVMWYLMPETKDRTLQEIEDEFKGKSDAKGDVEEKKSLKVELTDIKECA